MISMIVTMTHAHIIDKDAAKFETLIFIKSDSKVLLGLKKRGFAVGTWNGYGGKCTPDEVTNPVKCAQRELEEESKLIVDMQHFKHLGHFKIVYGAICKRTVHVYTVDAALINGEPMETHEMRPQWFPIVDMPWKTMLPDAPYWMHLVFEEKPFLALISLHEDKTLKTICIRPTDAIQPSTSAGY